MDEDLEYYINSLSKNQLRVLAFNAVDYLVDIDSVRFHPEDDELPTLYWETNGEDLLDDGN